MCTRAGSNLTFPLLLLIPFLTFLRGFFGFEVSPETPEVLVCFDICGNAKDFDALRAELEDVYV